ncbi:MAG TPA: DNA primase [Gemmatales bacterium]|nr:DNA primase [Gemmatales bacterium]
MSDDFAKLVKERCDIVEVIGSYVNLQKAGRMFKGICPFHDDHRPSFSVNPEKQSWKCWPCNLGGDVFTFIMKKERMDFREALDFLARRVGLVRKQSRQAGPSRAEQFDALQWTAQRYHECLFFANSQRALHYICEERQMAPETLERYQIGYAPNSWDWLSNQISQNGKLNKQLQELRVCGVRDDGKLFDCFRDRIIFPIRDVQGRVVAFGGRLLPDSPTDRNPPKYYNSADSSLFKKSQHLYGLDIARSAAEQSGYLAVVEGYMDVLMAHQCGILHVVATLGTALNDNHIAQLKRYVSRVVLVFDSDAGGQGGVERALGLFVQSEMELAIASLPPGMDPYDFLKEEGPAAFLDRLKHAQDALEYTLTSAFAAAGTGIEGQRQAMEKVLTVLARLPTLAREKLAVKREMILSRLAQRCGLNDSVIRNRYNELVREHRSRETSLHGALSSPTIRKKPLTPEDKLERELIQVLLVEPRLIQSARLHVQPEMMSNPNRQRVLSELYDAHEQGSVSVDVLRERLSDEPRLVEVVSRLHAEGMEMAHPEEWYLQVLEAYLRDKLDAEIESVRGELLRWNQSAPPQELLMKLQELQRRAGNLQGELRSQMQEEPMNH